MRQTHSLQLCIGQIPIESIEFDIHSRDELPQILQGLQHLYVEHREAVFAYLEQQLSTDADPNNGRPGMSLWQALVLGVVRLGLNCDYDHLTELANQHLTLRQMLGHGLLNADARYALQTIRDNVRRFTPDIIEGLNRRVIQAGHLQLKQDHVPLRGRCDSFVVETDVHYPTDINLLRDAVRVVLRLCVQACDVFDLGGWRQADYHLNVVSRLYRAAQNRKASTAKDPAKIAARQQAICDAHQALLDHCRGLLLRIDRTLNALSAYPEAAFYVQSIQRYRAHLVRQIDQIDRRVLQGEMIPHAEKVFSLFQEHTEWIVKGKAGVPVELGVRVCILTDHMGFILHHQVMDKQTDDQIAVEMIEQAQQRFPRLIQASFDKGFYSPQNRTMLEKKLDWLVMPKKGKCNQAEQARESAAAFVKARRQHSAVESSINALEQHGLDRCRDHGLGGFKRYVAFAVLARNLQILGAILHRQRQEQAQQARCRSCQRVAA